MRAEHPPPGGWLVRPTRQCGLREVSEPTTQHLDRLGPVT